MGETNSSLVNEIVKFDLGDIDICVYEIKFSQKDLQAFLVETGEALPAIYMCILTDVENDLTRVSLTARKAEGTLARSTFASIMQQIGRILEENFADSDIPAAFKDYINNELGGFNDEDDDTE